MICSRWMKHGRFFIAFGGNMRRLMYCSSSTGQWSGSLSNDLARILMQSRHHNHEANVTGVLCFKEGHYLQVLEGPSESVGKTYRRIKSDSRHANVELLLDETTEERLFERWAMKLSSGNHAELATFLRSSIPQLLSDKSEHSAILRKFVPKVLTAQGLPSAALMSNMEVRLSAVPSTAGHCKDLGLLDIMGRLIRRWCPFDDLVAVSGQSPEEMRIWLEEFYRAGHLRVRATSAPSRPLNTQNDRDGFYDRFRNVLRKVWA